jgi:long-chain fatty acid transport protein
MRRVQLVAAALAIAAPAGAHAAGLYFSERGVRPLGRGGAFTAGADDLGAIWYNPAGLYDAGSQILFDASWLNFTADYARRALLPQVDPNTGEVVARFEQTFEPVEGSSPVLPIPTLGVSFRLGDDWVLAVAAAAPYSAITSYPELVGGRPAPQRYSLITLEGSALGILGVWAAWRPHADWRVGAGVEVLAGKFDATVMFSGCLPDRFFCAPEDPDWDSLSHLAAGPIVAPSGNVGVVWKPLPLLRAGAAFHGPYFIRAPAQITARLPRTPVFETARQEGSDADVAFELPLSVRWGLEIRPLEPLRVELDGSFEAWAMHDELAVTPDGIALRNVVGFPDPFLLPEQSIPRNFENTWSVRLGAEYAFRTGELVWQPRAGLSYETSAIPPEYLSVMTIDMDKLTVGVGGSVYYDAWRFDLVFAHVFGIDVDVAPEDARVPQRYPLEANLPSPHYVNGGTYAARANVVGVGLRYSFDGPRAAELPDAMTAPAEPPHASGETAP